ISSNVFNRVTVVWSSSTIMTLGNVVSFFECGAELINWTFLSSVVCVRCRAPTQPAIHLRRARPGRISTQCAPHRVHPGDPARYAWAGSPCRRQSDAQPGLYL